MGVGKLASGIESRLHQLDEPDKPDEEVSLRFLFEGQSHKTLHLLTVSELTVIRSGISPIGPVSFSLNSGEVLHLTGANGSGKSSIIQAIMDKVAYKNSVRINNSISAIVIDQNQMLPLPRESATVNIKHLSPGIEMHDAINLLLRFNILKEALSTPVEQLSGGERAKILLASIAATNAELVILDEPTNNLDIPTIEALEVALKGYSGGILLVSHDRDFVDTLGVTRSVSLD